MISFNHVFFSYGGAHKSLSQPALDEAKSFAVKDLSLTINQGEFVAVLGANGSGKSTFARLINGLLIPGAGEVRVGGMSTFEKQHIFDIRQTVGMVFQNPDDQIVASLVEQDVAFGLENLGVKNPNLAERVACALEQVGLSGYKRRDVNTLSGGEKQRLALAGVLAMNPQVLVLDEAASMLDPQGRHAFLDLCEALHKQGITLIMITHMPEDALRAERVIVFSEGRCVMDGSCQQVFSRTQLLERYNIRAPFALELSRALQKRQVRVTDQVSVDALYEELCLLRESSKQSE